jgi:hypothetical protein
VTLAMVSDAIFKDPSLVPTVLTAPQLSLELRQELSQAA